MLREAPDEMALLSEAGQGGRGHEEPPPPRVRATPKAKQRVMALDAFRGFNVMLMILVDNAGGSFPLIDHSPWDGATLADMVMPWFDFMVGVSIALSFKQFVTPSLPSSHLPRTNVALNAKPRGDTTRGAGFQKSTWRFLKIFFLGMFTQGCKDMFVCDISRIRIMGILQRVAVCFFATAVVELLTGHATKRVPLVPPYSDARAHMAVFQRSRWHWLGCTVLCTVWAIIMWGVDVPPAFGEACGRGVWTPACNAQRVVDATVLGVDHMYFPSNGGDDAGRGMTFQRLPACSTCSPGLCTAPVNSANKSVWCEHAPFDPEGLVSSLTAVADTFIGAHAGFVILVLSQGHRRLAHWFGLGVVMVAIALPLHFSGVHPMNTDLYTFSFLLFTSGMGMLMLALFYWVELRFGGGSRGDGCGSYILAPAVWVGRNAITIYVLAESGVVNWAFGIIYLYGDTDYSLANVLWPTGVFWGDSGDDDHRASTVSHNSAVLVWTLAYILIWTLVAR